MWLKDDSDIKDVIEQKKINLVWACLQNVR